MTEVAALYFFMEKKICMSIHIELYIYLVVSYTLLQFATLANIHWCYQRMKLEFEYKRETQRGEVLIKVVLLSSGIKSCEKFVAPRPHSVKAGTNHIPPELIRCRIRLCMCVCI